MAFCGTFVGTAKYMAPEQLGGKAYSYAADVWALGICLVRDTPCTYRQPIALQPLLLLPARWGVSHGG